MSEDKKKEILITGASGFVGSHIARRARELGHEVIAPTHADLPLENREAVHSFVASVKPQAVFHLATSILASGKTADPHTVIQTNVEGTVNLMDAALSAHVAVFINTGTCFEYGPKDHSPTEDERCDPIELYATTKFTATLYGQGLALRQQFPCATLRLFTPYGPNMKERSLVRAVMGNILTHQPVLLSERTVTRDFVYVNDVAELYLEVMEKASQYRGEIFNVGSGTATTFEELLTTAEQTTGIQADIKWGAFPLQSYDKALWQADMNKTFAAFSWRPRTSLPEGLSLTAQSFS